MDNSNDPGSRGASKQRRELINIEIQKIRDLLPLNSCVKDRLFQLQVMSLACIYIRKHKYLPYILQTCGKDYPLPYSTATPRGCDSCRALRGFLLMITKEGKLLYISDNASEYLGYSVEEIMCQGDSLYDLVDVRDHVTVQTELGIGPISGYSEYYPHESVFVCRMNLSKTAKRQVQYYKFVLVQGRYIHSMEHYKAVNHVMQGSAKIQPLFSAFCQPLINPENAENLAMGNPNIFTMVLSLELIATEMNLNAKEMLGYTSNDYINMYNIVHPEDLGTLKEAHCKLIREKEGVVVSLIRLENASKRFIWLHTVFMSKSTETSTYIQATFQAVGQAEGQALQNASWVYCPSTYQSMRDKDAEYDVSSPESVSSHDKSDDVPEGIKHQTRAIDVNNNNNITKKNQKMASELNTSRLPPLISGPAGLASQNLLMNNINHHNVDLSALGVPPGTIGSPNIASGNVGIPFMLGANPGGLSLSSSGLAGQSVPTAPNMVLNDVEECVLQNGFNSLATLPSMPVPCSIPYDGPFSEPLSLCPASLFGLPLPELGDDLDEYFKQVEQESTSRKRDHSQITPSTASTSSCYDYEMDYGSYRKIKRESTGFDDYGQDTMADRKDYCSNDQHQLDMACDDLFKDTVKNTVFEEAYGKNTVKNTIFGEIKDDAIVKRRQSMPDHMLHGFYQQDMDKQAIFNHNIVHNAYVDYSNINWNELPSNNNDFYFEKKLIT
ncbi:unnamed protein product [Bursaphelenchus okinawaensis]|uniref:Uncharacterized protein n=1 Tax=Bursaphelenchus okinawaensis TaxID=465554 RepID=A0A811L587_9BILA|nr:unnamed protein product [Bursaphelenchus okinawaensis]CAG9116949.1 unnamed protein product [Bursaphelenchus okinawaensis]